MNGYYVGKVKVVGNDLMCFPARVSDLEPLACGCYDPYAWSDKAPEPWETIGIGEWQRRRNEQWRKTYNVMQQSYLMQRFASMTTRTGERPAQEADR